MNLVHLDIASTFGSTKPSSSTDRSCLGLGLSLYIYSYWTHCVEHGSWHYAREGAVVKRNFFDCVYFLNVGQTVFKHTSKKKFQICIKSSFTSTDISEQASSW